MLRSKLRVTTMLVVTVMLVLGFIPGVGIGNAMAASAPTANLDGVNPVASGPTEIGYCYPSGYNRNGWRCGWRLAQAPYNLGDYNNYYYNTGYWYNGYWYNYPGYGTGGYPVNNGVVDYGGKPRFNPYYYYGYNYNPCYNYGYNYSPYCYAWQP